MLSSFYILVAFLASAYAFKCPLEYTYANLTQNGVNKEYCYKVYVTYFDRQQAVTRCAQDGATLATITSAQENDLYINADQVTDSLTFGLSCIDNANCAFNDGTPFNATSYNRFSGGHPNTNLGGCVALQTAGSAAGSWSNIPCSLLGSFICSYKPFTVTNIPSGGCNSLHALQLDTTTSITVTSPNFPYYYDNWQSCSYYFYATTGSSLNITFTTFTTEPNHDYVRIYNGGDLSSGTLIDSYSGPWNTFTVTVPNRESLMTFTTDSSVVRAGFSATVISF